MDVHRVRDMRLRDDIVKQLLRALLVHRHRRDRVLIARNSVQILELPAEQDMQRRPMDARLIDGERRGTWVYYRAVPAAVERMAAALDAVAPLAEAPA